MNLQKRLMQWVFKEEYNRLHDVITDVTADWQMIPYVMQRQGAFATMVSEMDSQLYDLMVRNLRDFNIVSNATASDSYRVSTVKQSRAMYLTDPVYSHGVRTWTDFGFGQQPKLSVEDADAQKLWNEFWSADRNAQVLGERKIHKLSDDELVDGELFFAIFASTLDGLATVRTIDPTEIKEILYDPEDRSIPLFYRREYGGAEGGLSILYYPDWSATDEQLARAKLPADARRADQVQAGLPGEAGTDVKVLHAAYREVNGRGWPLASTGVEWENAYSSFLKDRAAVARAAASVVEKIKAKGGQRAIDAIRASIGSSIPGGTDSYEKNPPPVAGSTWIENESLTREWMNRPTGASDAEKDGIPLITQVGLAFGLFPHYLGRGDYYRLATATAMEMPVLKSFNRYQNFWGSVWTDMFKIVCNFTEEYGGQTFESKEATVSSNRIINLAIEDIARIITGLNDLVDRALVPSAASAALAQALIRAALETMGIGGVDEMFTAPEQAKEAGGDRRPFRG